MKLSKFKGKAWKMSTRMNDDDDDYDFFFIESWWAKKTSPYEIVKMKNILFFRPLSFWYRWNIKWFFLRIEFFISPARLYRIKSQGLSLTILSGFKCFNEPWINTWNSLCLRNRGYPNLAYKKGFQLPLWGNWLEQEDVGSNPTDSNIIFSH